MKELEHKSEVPNIIVIKDVETYLNLVLVKEDRPYDVVVFFNLSPEEAQERCEHCVLSEAQFGQLAYSFVQQRSSKSDEHERIVFFCLFHLDTDDKIRVFSHNHGYSTIPWLSVSPIPE